jgi:DNA-binding PucR family transcriptional regulator
VAKSRRSPGTSALPTDRAITGGDRSERVEALLAGESLDTSRFSYDFELDHVALICAGAGAETAINDRAGSTVLPHLVAESGRGTVWAWFGNREGFEVDVLMDFLAPIAIGDVRLAIGGPARGLGGWRLSHHQARAAMAVAERSREPIVRYADVALLASLVRDDLLATSLCRLYIEPLEGDRDGGEELRRTLRAYFDADRNISEAGSAIGVTRQAVARRLRAAEERIGRPLGACSAELELALRFEALAPTPLSAP